MQILKRIENNKNFQEFFKGFKRSISRKTVLDFIKKRILLPNSVQYLECNNTLDVIDLKNKKAYIFVHLEFKYSYEYDPYYLPGDVMYEIRKVLKNNRVFGISKNRNIIFVIGKNAMFFAYFDEKLGKHTVSFFINKKGKYTLDEIVFAKFLIELIKNGLANEKWLNNILYDNRNY
jgi:hypothetical protein